MRTILAWTLTLLLLVGASLPGLAKKPPAAPSGSPEQIEDFDTALGRRLYPLALARGGGEASLGRAGRYLQVIFDDLAGSARRQRRLDYSLHVLSSRERLDAWALPDGAVFVTVGLLRHLYTDDEVAGVLAHQLAHAVLRHNVNDLTSSADQAFLADLAAGKVPLVREKLGRYGRHLLGEYYSSGEERAADALARGLLRQAGFRESGLENSFRRVAGKPLPAYLLVHPHPGLKPLPAELNLPPIIISEEPAPVWPPLPPARPVLPLPPPRSPVYPVPAPSAPPRPREPESLGGLTVLGGLYPVWAAKSQADVTFSSDENVTVTLPVETAGARNGATLAALAETPFGRNWQGLFGGGWVTADLFAGRPRGNGGFLAAGILRRGSVDGRGLRWAAGPYLGYTWMAVDAGRTPEGAEHDLVYHTDAFYPPGEVVEGGSRVTARASSLSAGALLSLSGDTPAPGLAWFAAVGAQASLPGAWRYTAVAYNTGNEVTLPVKGENAAPLSTDGVLGLAGVVFRF